MSSFVDYFQKAKAHFVACHQHPVNQVFHHITNALAIVAVISIFFDWRWTLAILVLTQILALSGHFVFEKNQPAAVKYPGITILASLSWSFDHWFGLKPLFSAKKAAGRSSLGR